MLEGWSLLVFGGCGGACRLVDPALGEGCGVAGTLGVPSHPKSLGRVCSTLGGQNPGFSFVLNGTTRAVEAEMAEGGGRRGEGRSGAW